MSDYRNQLIKSIENSLITVLDPETHQIVTNIILRLLNDYEITRRCTDLAVYDDQNERLLKRYCACLMVDGKSQKTIYAYKRSITRFHEFLGIPFTDIDAYDIRYYLASRQETRLSAVSVENERSMLSAFFKWLTEEEIISKNPCASIKPIKCPDEEKFPFSPVELDAIRSACNSLKERAIIETLVSSGVRVAELENMDVSDVDFGTLTVRVRHGKGGKDRTTFINDVAKLHLQKYLLSREDTCTALIVNRDGFRIHTGGIRYVLKEIGKRASVNNVHPHRFRRTFATDLAKRGMPIQEVQKLLGHSDINTTLRYAVINKDKIKASYQQYIA